ncbi:hypothetical protein A9Q94_04790 [Rhodobacterales bacterium 56_14_T64]|nr:hypothetical protein A9Q94_04790 [Rhodobacterales bacterium 56_14_T64]
MTDAEKLTAQLGGRWYGHYGTAPCPACQPDGRRDQTALTLSDGPVGLLTHCKRSDCDFIVVMAAAGLPCSGHWNPPDPIKAAQPEHHLEVIYLCKFCHADRDRRDVALPGQLDLPFGLNSLDDMRLCRPGARSTLSEV